MNGTETLTITHIELITNKPEGIADAPVESKMDAPTVPTDVPTTANSRATIAS